MPIIDLPPSHSIVASSCVSPKKMTHTSGKAKTMAALRKEPVTFTSLSQNQSSTSGSTVNITLSLPQERRTTPRDLQIPTSRNATAMKAWTVSLIAGMARTNYTISGSTCDTNNCRGVVQRVYIFDVGAQLQWRPSNRTSLGVTVTKEQSIYGSLGFNF
jgi:hypothetical protein